MVQEQFALTAKASGWKASFQSGLGAQHHPHTDRAFQTHIQTSWSGNSGTPMSIKPSVLHVAFPSASSLFICWTNISWNFHRKNSPYGQKWSFQLQCESNPELRRKNHWHLHPTALNPQRFLPQALLLNTRAIVRWQKCRGVGSHLSHLPSHGISRPL